MAMQVWFADDMRNMLRGLLETANESEMSAEKFDGYLLAVRSFARGLGIDVRCPERSRGHVIDARARVLEVGEHRTGAEAGGRFG